MTKFSTEIVGFTTGDAKITLKTVADPGWLMMNDNAIGNPTSGAAYANNDAYDLFVLIFNNIADSAAPIFTSTGTGTTRAAQGTAAAAWAANCRMSLTKQLGRSISVAGSGAGLTTRPLGGAQGSETETQTISKLVSHNHGTPLWNWTPAVFNVPIPGGGADINYFVTNTGGGLPLDIVQPVSFWNVMIKL